MPVRPATFSDLLPAAHAAARAFFDEPLFGPIIHPHRHTYPGDVYLFFLRYFRQTYFSATNCIIVSHPPSAPATVTGVALWTRKGSGATALERDQGWWIWLCGRAMAALNRVHEWAYPNRAVDPSKAGILDRAYPFIAHYWQEPVARSESWYLELCATDPRGGQGMGYGRDLVAWGVAKARAEGICASLIAAAGKEGFYRKCGFVHIGGWAGEGEGNPIKDVAGGAIMFADVPVVEEK